jgi:diguanylate cyclase (GGDEF)-like protein
VDGLGPGGLIFILLAAGAAGAIGFVRGRAGKEGLREAVTRLEAEVGRAEAKLREHDRTVTRMRREHSTVANLALHLPDVVSKMNRDDLEPTDVPRLILSLAEAVFQPTQIVLYGVRSVDGAEGRRRDLVLIEQRGLDKIPVELKTIPFGTGKIGWVAHHELERLPEDWEKMRQSERIDVPDNHPSFRPELMGPLVHRTRDGTHALGVLCIGSPGIRPADPKLMFQLVANLGSLALVSAKNVKTLRAMANHDGLTKLLNKRCFLDQTGADALLHCERGAKPFSLFIFDIDNFKTYNDTNGHPAGDRLLQEMAELLRRTIRPQDLACRYGGEEFVVGMPNTDRDEGLAEAEKMRRAVAAAAFAHREKQPKGYVSISGGVAAFPKDGSNIRELIQHADEALYYSKKSGRDRVTPYQGVTIGGLAELPAPIVEVGAAGPTEADAYSG